MSTDATARGSITTIPNNPTILSLIPLVYVAWADGELSPEEIKQIRGKLIGKAWVKPATEDFLDVWLQPDAPPTAAQMQALLLTIRRAGRSLAAPQRSSLAAMGEAIAQEDLPPELSRVLREIEQAVGLVGSDAARDLLGAESATHEPPLGGEGGAKRVDALAIQRLLDGEWAEFRDRIRALLSEPVFDYRYGLSKEEYREQVYVWTKRLAAEGLGSLSYPRPYGGEADIEKFAIAFEMLAFGDISLLIKFGVQFGLFGGSINMLGTERHHSRYLTEVGTLELPGCFAMTERGHGSNVAGVETTATYDPIGDEFVIHTPVDQAHKEYIGNAACHARLATVFAQLVVAEESHGVHAILVPIRDTAGRPMPGVRIEDSGHKLGLNGVDNGRLWFDQVRVPRENLLNRYADVDESGNYTSTIASPSRRFFTTLGALVAGRVSIALGSLSAAKSGLTIAIRYGDGRRQFGPPGEPEVRILDYLTHQRRLMPPLAGAYALDFGLKYLTRRFANRTDADQREVEALAAGLKAYSSWHAIETLQTCRECCGGQGYLAVNRFADLKADIDIFTTFEGDNTVLMLLLAKGLLSDYKRQFEDLRAYTIFRFLADQAETVVVELNPVVTRMTDEEHLRDPEFQLAAFEYREKRLIASAAQRLRNRIQNGIAPDDAFNECRDHLVAMAWGHTERLVFEKFSDGVRDADDSLRATLKPVCDLFALSRIEADRGWFLESGYLTPTKSKAIRTMVTKLCSQNRRVALPLVDAFGIPDAVLSAPVATLDESGPETPA